ncbi:hypothetical protein M408DRAFT_281160 [Serendipita vermifera MAFF 305830]|uniref:Uncharacterized protein n=1 Tax=Serendipita vermifera MAFF 305830 TaxID=933852 RepID=A0A0C2WZM9_SERVB|nr:hypothetical protein M408DRAFT_281160 [Serendipita vermifera MAFF 305830]
MGNWCLNLVLARSTRYIYTLYMHWMTFFDFHREGHDSGENHEAAALCATKVPTTSPGQASYTCATLAAVDRPGDNKPRSVELSANYGAFRARRCGGAAAPP